MMATILLTLILCFVFRGCCYISTGGDKKNSKAYATYPEAVQAYVRNDPLLKKQIEKANPLVSPNPLRTFLANTVLLLVVSFLLGIFMRTDSLTQSKNIREQIGVLLESHQDADDALWEESSNYILPSIAVYLILKNHVGPQEALDLFRTIYFEAAYEGAAFLQRKAEDRTFREEFVHDMAGNKEGERGGFRFHLVKNDPTGAEFHVLQCPYCDFCATHQCRELISIFCECDDVVYGNIHPLLRWERTETLGQGQKRCNFKFSILSTEK